ncbi:MAG: glycosyltransferase, partial [Bacteroidota bacterium]
MATITLLSAGSRGDIQPFVALGLGLQGRGHEVRLCAPAPFQAFVEAQGLAYRYMDGGILKLIGDDSVRQFMEAGDRGWLSWMKLALELNSQAKPMSKRMFEDVWPAARGSDLIVYHPKVLAGSDVAEALGVPEVLALPFPSLVPTSEEPMLLFPRWRLGGWYNRATYISTWIARSMYHGVLQDFRKAHLGLPPRKRFVSQLKNAAGQLVPSLHAYSRHVAPPPSDWPETSVVTGYWFLDEPGWTPPEDLAQFLDAGDPPVYIGFGSMVGTNPEAKGRLVLAAVEQVGCRAVLGSGWGGLAIEETPAEVFVLDQAPHAWLFPRMAGVVHHGGAGTTAAGLRAGRPTFICPFFGDQPYWGRRVEMLGVGPAPVRQRDLTVERLAAGLRRLVSDATMQARAEALGEQIRAEDG